MVSNSPHPLHLAKWNDGKKIVKPKALACSNNTLFIADRENEHILMADASLASEKLLEDTSTPKRSSGYFAEPFYVWTGPEDVLYLTESLNGVVFERNEGLIRELAGKPAYSDKTGTMKSSGFFNPRGGYFDPNSGLVYVADYGNEKLKVINTREDLVTSIGSGQRATVDGKFSQASFHAPSDICGSSKPHILYVSETTCIRFVDLLERFVGTFAGDMKATGFQDGPRLEARFNRLSSITSMGDSIFVADRNNSKIRMVSNNVVSTVAETSFPPFGICLTPRGHLLYSMPKSPILGLVSFAYKAVAATYGAFESLLDAPDLNLLKTPLFDQQLPLPLIDLVYPKYPLTRTEWTCSHLTPSYFVKFLATNHIEKSLPLETTLELLDLLCDLETPLQIRRLVRKHVAWSLEEVPVAKAAAMMPALMTRRESLSTVFTSLKMRMTSEVIESTIQSFDEDLQAILRQLLGEPSQDDPTTPDTHSTIPYIQRCVTSLYWRTVAQAELPIDVMPLGPLTLSLEPNFEIITVEGASIRCHDWLLYARWPFFQHLVKSGLSEAAAGKIQLDSLLDATVRALIRFFYTDQAEDFIESPTLCLDLLRHARRFNLATMDPVFTPMEAFEPFLINLLQDLITNLDVSNCIDAYNTATEIGSPSLRKRAAKCMTDCAAELVTSNQPFGAVLLKAFTLEQLGEIWLVGAGGDATEWKKR